MISVLVGPLLQGFFSEHLAQHRQVSFQTIASYRDTFRLLLQFVRDKKGVEPAVLTLDALDAPHNPRIFGILGATKRQLHSEPQCPADGDPLLLSSRCLAGTKLPGYRYRGAGNPDQTMRQAIGRLHNSRRGGCDSDGPGSTDLDGAPGPRFTPHDVQHRSTSLRDDDPVPRTHHSGTETLCAFGRQGTKAKNDTLVAQYGEGPSWLAGRSLPPS